MNIMFICTGNICRSAMAHWLLDKKIKDLKRNDIKISSCGTQAGQGDMPTWEAKKVMEEKYNINMDSHRATNVNNSNIKDMDLILCATTSHKIAVLSKFPKLNEKVYTIKEYVNYNKQNHDNINLQDPWGYNLETYRGCLEEIEECINILLEKI